MEGISDIKIIGIDVTRPPKIRKEPYIDIFFRLSHKAPPDWCDSFNSLMARHPFAPKIIKSEGLYIQTWVRNPDEIVPYLAQLKDKVAECSRLYIEAIALSARNAGADNDALANEPGEQGRLNRIIAALEFDEVETP